MQKPQRKSVALRRRGRLRSTHPRKQELHVPHEHGKKVAGHVQDRDEFSRADNTHLSCTQPIANLLMACCKSFQLC